MSSIEIKPSIRVEIAEVLNGISNLETGDIELFLKEVAHILAKRKAQTLSQKETELLLKINYPLLSENLKDEYHQLYSKLQDETITQEEHSKLIELIQKQEEKGAERLSALIELSQIRGISPKEMMHELGISSLSHAE